MLEIIRFDHISQAAVELDPQVELLEGLFGFRYAGRFEEPGFVGVNLDVPGGSGLGWEVIAPSGPTSYLHRFLRGMHGPGLHHVTLRVPSIPAAVNALRAEGIEPWAGREDEDEDEDGEGAGAPGAGESGAFGEVSAEVAGAPTEEVADAPGAADAEEPMELDAGFAQGAEAAFADAPPSGVPGEGGPSEGGAPYGDRGQAFAARGDEDPHGVTYIHPRQGGQGFLYQLYAGEPWNVAEPFRDADEHSLGIIAVNHLSHAHADRDELARWYGRVFGMREIYRSPDEAGAESGFRTVVLETPTRQLRFEVIAPAGPDSFIQRFLEHRGPSMHHVTFEVEDWDRAMAACLHYGVQVFGERIGETDGVDWREAFIHPRSTGGMLVQFFWQAEPGVWI